MYLTILMAERVGLIIILAFLLVSVPLFRRLLFNQNSTNDSFFYFCYYG